MLKKVISAGMLGGVVLIVWTCVVNGILGFQASIDMKRIVGERQVYEMLKEHIVDPGRYTCNPAPTSEGRLPDGEPVFSVSYGGVGREAAGRLMLIDLIAFLLAPIIGAWMLSRTSEQMMSSYPRKVLFFTAIGLLFAIFIDLTNVGIGRYPVKDAIMLAVSHIIVWTLVGCAVAWRIRPDQTGPVNG